MRFRKIAVVTVLLWCAAGLALLWWSSATVMSGPPDGDLYAHSWGYQLFSRVVVFGPMFLGMLAILLAVEWVITRLVRRP